MSDINNTSQTQPGTAQVNEVYKHIFPEDQRPLSEREKREDGKLIFKCIIDHGGTYCTYIYFVKYTFLEGKYYDFTAHPSGVGYDWCDISLRTGNFEIYYGDLENIDLTVIPNDPPPTS